MTSSAFPSSDIQGYVVLLDVGGQACSGLDESRSCQFEALFSLRNPDGRAELLVNSSEEFVRSHRRCDLHVHLKVRVVRLEILLTKIDVCLFFFSSFVFRG